MNRTYIYIDVGADPGTWRVHNSPTSDFEVAGTVHAVSVSVEIPGEITAVNLDDLIEDYKRLRELENKL